jgi:hypothetical protein
MKKITETPRPSMERMSNLLHEAEPYHEPAAIWRSKVRDDAQIRRGSLAIICGGDRGDIIGQSLRMGQEICQSEFREKSPWPYNPEDIVKHTSVLYLNVCSSREHIRNQSMGLWPGAHDWSLKRDRYLRENPAQDAPFHLFHVPGGEIASQFAEILLQVRTKRISVVIMNDFEDAARTARHRDDLVFHLITLRDLGCTVIVFASGEKRKIDKQARGPLAHLRRKSDVVLDQSIFTELVYAQPCGSTHASEEEYYESTGECGREYFKRVRELSGWTDGEETSVEEELPDKLMAAEIEDNIRDKIELPQEAVDAGVYTSDGEMICASETAALQTMNTYTIHTNNYQSVAHASACAARMVDGAAVIVHK